MEAARKRPPDTPDPVSNTGTRKDSEGNASLGGAVSPEVATATTTDPTINEGESAVDAKAASVVKNVSPTIPTTRPHAPTSGEQDVPVIKKPNQAINTTSSADTTATSGSEKPSTPLAKINLRKPHERTPAVATSVSPSKPSTRLQPPVVWSTQGARALRQQLSGEAPGSMDNSDTGGAKYAEHYECALRPSNLRRDGDQRPMTRLKKTTLHLYFTSKLELDDSPLFLYEIHTGQQPLDESTSTIATTKDAENGSDEDNRTSEETPVDIQDLDRADEEDQSMATEMDITDRPNVDEEMSAAAFDSPLQRHVALLDSVDSPTNVEKTPVRDGNNSTDAAPPVEHLPSEDTRKRTRPASTPSDEEPDRVKWVCEDKADGVAFPQTRAKKQTTVSDYFKPGPKTTDQLLAELKPKKVDWSAHFLSPELEQLLDQQFNPRDLHEWLDSIGAKEVDVPANGACFWYALHAIKARWCGGED